VTDYVTAAEVQASVGLDPAPVDADVVTATSAANAWASALPHAPLDPADPRFHAGVKLLAMRYYKRKFSPEGVGLFGEVALYAARRDPDVDQLLRLGAWAPGRVG
jgi:hypothetical protein